MDATIETPHTKAQQDAQQTLFSGLGTKELALIMHARGNFLGQTPIVSLGISGFLYLQYLDGDFCESTMPTLERVKPGLKMLSAFLALWEQKTAQMEATIFKPIWRAIDPTAKKALARAAATDEAAETGAGVSSGQVVLSTPSV